MRVIRIDVRYSNGRHRPVLLPIDDTLWGTVPFTCSLDGSKPVKATIPESSTGILGLAHFVRQRVTGEVVYE